MLKLALVGAGQISERFLKQAAATPDARFVAICARRLENAQARAREYEVEGSFDDYQTMFDRVRPDAVVIATPPSVHAAPAIAALERGIHVLCEKPMAVSLEECRAMVAAAQGSGTRLMCLPYDYNPAFATASEYLNEATLGKFTGAEAVLLIPGPPRDNWYYQRSVAGGGAMLDTLVYPASRLISLLGPARRVSGMVNTLIPKRIVGDGKTVESDVDDNVTLTIEWAGGQQAVLRSLWGTSLSRNDTTIYGRHGTLWLANNQVIIHSPDAPVRNADPVVWQNFTHCYRVPLPAEARSESIIDHFVESLANGTEPKCNGRLQLHVHEILFKGYLAAESGRTQELETSFTPTVTLEAGFFDTRGAYI